MEGSSPRYVGKDWARFTSSSPFSFTYFPRKRIKRRKRTSIIFYTIPDRNATRPFPCREIHFDPLFALSRIRERIQLENFSMIESPSYRTESKKDSFEYCIRETKRYIFIYTHDFYLYTNIGFVTSVLVACKHEGTTRRFESVRDANSTKTVVGVLSFRG